MNTTIKIERRNVYGNELLYVVGQQSSTIAKLTGKKTVSQSDLKALIELGFQIEIK